METTLTKWAILFSSILAISSCGPDCNNESSSYQYPDFRNVSFHVSSVDSNNKVTYLKADSIYLIYPKTLKIDNNGKVPISHETNLVTIVVYHQGFSKDTVSIKYDFYTSKERDCSGMYDFGLTNIGVQYNTFAPKYKVNVDKLMVNRW